MSTFTLTSLADCFFFFQCLLISFFFLSEIAIRQFLKDYLSLQLGFGQAFPIFSCLLTALSADAVPFTLGLASCICFLVGIWCVLLSTRKSRFSLFRVMQCFHFSLACASSPWAVFTAAVLERYCKNAGSDLWLLVQHSQASQPRSQSPGGSSFLTSFETGELHIFLSLIISELLFRSSAETTSRKNLRLAPVIYLLHCGYCIESMANRCRSEISCGVAVRQPWKQFFITRALVAFSSVVAFSISSRVHKLWRRTESQQLQIHTGLMRREKFRDL